MEVPITPDLIEKYDKFYTTYKHWFTKIQYKVEVDIYVNSDKNYYWRYSNQILKFWRPIQFKNHLDYLFINDEVVYSYEAEN